MKLHLARRSSPQGPLEPLCGAKMKNPVVLPLEADDEAPWNCRKCIREIVWTGKEIVWESAVAEGQELSNETDSQH